MVKWIDEKILQFYWKENYKKYSIKVGNEDFSIGGCDFNQPFDEFPDVINVINNQKIPAEVEWLSSHYDHDTRTKDKHDEFVAQGGFLVVFKKDKEIHNLKQIEIDHKDFKGWFKKNANRIFDESVDSFLAEVVKKRSYPKIWVVYLGSAMDKNYHVGRNKGIWGFTEGRFGMSNNLIKDIKEGDIILFFGPTEGIPIRLPQEEFLDRVKKDKKIVIKHIAAYKITTNYFNEKEKDNYEVIWPDENLENKKYPHRFLFNKNAILSFKEVRFNKIATATQKSLWHKMLTSPNEINYPDFVELIRNFTFKREVDDSELR